MIKECHGDLHSGNIFVLPNEKIYIFDAIEFNKEFTYIDVYADITFLLMDLEFHNCYDFSEHLLKKYLSASNDEYLPDLLNFYKCYRAYVRGKINSFSNKFTLANKYFELAFQYCKNF